MKQGKDIQALAAEIARQSETKKDFICDTRHLQMQNSALDGPVLQIEDQEPLPITQSAHRQIGDRVGIPAKYYDRMAADAPDLLCQNVNRWFVDRPEARMVRTLDGSARAFLSDRYQRIDNWDVAQVVLPIFAEMADENGLEIISTEITERRMYLKAVSKRVFEEVKKDDIVQAGISISNSEIGQGAFVVQPLAYRLWCLNGCVVNDARLHKHHVGGRTEIGSDTYALLSDETLRAEDETLMLKARDVVKGALSTEGFRKIVDRMRDAADRPITGNPVKAVEVLGKTFGLTETEGGDVMRHLIEGGDLSQWGILNAVTAIANTTESYDRASDIETMGGRILDMAPGTWKEIAEAA